MEGGLGSSAQEVTVREVDLILRKKSHKPHQKLKK